MSENATPGSVDPSVPPSGPGCADCDGGRPARVVGAPAPLRRVRARRVLRLLTGPARDRARRRHRAPRRAELRAGRGLVLGLRRRGRWSTARRSPRRPPGPSEQSVPRSAGTGPGRLARPHPLMTGPPPGSGRASSRSPCPLGPACPRRPAPPRRRRWREAHRCSRTPRPHPRPPLPAARPGRPARRPRRRRRHLGVDRHPQARPAHGRRPARQRRRHPRAARRPGPVAARAAGAPRRRPAGAAALARRRAPTPVVDGPRRRLHADGLRRGHRPARRRGPPLHEPRAHPAGSGCSTTRAAREALRAFDAVLVGGAATAAAAARARRARPACGSSRPTA